MRLVATALIIVILLASAFTGIMFYYNGELNSRNSKISYLNTQIANLTSQISNLNAQITNITTAYPEIISHPIIEYNITGYAYTPRIWDFNPYGAIYSPKMPDTYTLVNSNTPLIIALNWKNTGKIDASLQLVLTTKDANITWFSNFGSGNITIPAWGTKSDGQTHNGTSATFLCETNGQSGVQSKFVDIMPIGNPQNFTINFSITDTSNAFTSIDPNGMTTATYELTNATMYQLVK